MPTIANLVVVLEANTSRFAGPLSGVSRTLTRSVTLPLVAAGAASVSMAAKFDQSMRNVNSIMGASEKQLARYSGQVERMTTRFPQSAETLANGLYDIASSGFQGADAMKILEASARAASAGMTEAEISSKAIVSVLNAYGLQAEDAARVSDILFKGVDKGVLSFEELASTLGDYVGAASQLAIPIEDVVAAQAAMTLTGLNAAEAATSLNNVMRSLLKPSEDMTKALKDMGFQSGQAALESIGLQGVIEGLSDRVGNNKQEWLKLFPEIRSARGAMALAANDGEGLTRIMKEMGDVTGATGRAFEEQSKGAMFQFQIMLNRLTKELRAVGRELIPIIMDDIIPAIRSAIKWWKGLSDETKSLVLKLAGLAALAGPLLALANPLVRLAVGVGRLGTGAAVAATAVPAVSGALGTLGSKAGNVTKTMTFLGRTMQRPALFTGAARGATGLAVSFGTLARAAGRAAGVLGAAYVIGDIPNQMPRDIDELITKYESMGDAARTSIFGVETAQEGLALSVRYLNQELEAQGIAGRISFKAFKLAAESGLNYANALKLVNAGLGNVDTKITEQLMPAFNGASRLTNKQAGEIIRLTSRINGISGPLTDVQRGYVEWFLRFGDVNGAIKYLNDELGKARKMTDDSTESVGENTRAMRRNRQALQDATGPAKRLANEFTGVGRQADGAERKVGILDRGLNRLPKRVVVTVDANITPAMLALRALRSGLSSVGATISGIGASIPQLHGGGHVVRSGLAMVHSGEDVLTPEQQRHRATRRGDRIDIRLDRRHYAGAFAYDQTFRGW